MEGGSANNYDYANGDPVNQFDLDGTCGRFGNPLKKCGSGHKGEQGFLGGAISKTYPHVTVGYSGCFYVCGDVKFQGGRLGGSIGVVGLVAKGPYVGYANQRAADRQSCYVIGGGGIGIVGSGSLGLPGENFEEEGFDFEGTAALGAGIQSGVMCGGSVHLPGLPE